MATVKLVAGFEQGTVAGFATGNAADRNAAAINGSPTIVTTTPRTGVYCLQVNPSAATHNIQYDTNQFGASQTRGWAGFAVRLISAPAGDVQLFGWANATATGQFCLHYHQSTNRFAASTTTGGTKTDGSLDVQIGRWYWVEIYADVSANPATMRWFMDGVEMTAPGSLAVAASTMSTMTLGGTASQTMNCLYDDLVVQTDTSAITVPQGQMRVPPLPINSASVYIQSATFTTADWKTFTANGGTLTAWNLTTARTNTVDIPPVIGASAAGLCIVTTPSVGEYVEINTDQSQGATATSNETIVGGRVLVCGWAASATANNIGLSTNNNTTITAIYSTADPNFDNSTTAPAWLCKMVVLADFDTQAELNVLAVRFGFSTSATASAVGMHAMMCEFAFKTTDRTADPNGSNGTGASDPSTPSVGVNAECATGTGSAGDPYISAVGVASGTGAAGDPYVSAVQDAEGTGSSDPSTPAIAVNDGGPAGTGTAGDPYISAVGVATGTGVAGDPYISAVGDGEGTGASDPSTPAIAVNDSGASGTGSAGDPYISAVGVATGTGSAGDPYISAVDVASGTGSAGDPYISAVECAQGTGTANDATVSTASSTNAPAECANGTGVAGDPTVSAVGESDAIGAAGDPGSALGVNASGASGTGSAGDPTVSAVGVSTGVGAAGDPGSALGVNDGGASGSGSSGDPYISAVECANGAGSAFDATVSTSTGTNAPAECATGSGTAGDPYVSAVECANGSGSAGDVLASAVGYGAGAGTAGDPAASVAAQDSGASGIGSAGDPNGLGTVSPGGSGSAGDPVPALSVNDGGAAGTGSALDATVSTASGVSAPAGSADGTGAAGNCSVTMFVNAECALSVGVALVPTFGGDPATLTGSDRGSTMSQAASGTTLTENYSGSSLTGRDTAPGTLLGGDHA